MQTVFMIVRYGEIQHSLSLDMYMLYFLLPQRKHTYGCIFSRNQVTQVIRDINCDPMAKIYQIDTCYHTNVALHMYYHYMPYNMSMCYISMYYYVTSYITLLYCNAILTRQLRKI